MDTNNIKKYNNLLYYSSYKTIISIIWGVYWGKYDYSLLCFIVFLTSINYWKNPIKGTRRNIDMFACWCSVIYHLKKSNSAKNIPKKIIILYNLLVMTCGYLYFKGSLSENIVFGLKLHSHMHTLGNIANLFLYPY